MSKTKSCIVGLDGNVLSSSGYGYEGATRGNRAVNWNAPSAGPNRILARALKPLRNRTRAGLSEQSFIAQRYK